MRPKKSVRCPINGDKLATRQSRIELLSRNFERSDLIARTLDNQGRYGDLRKILPEIGHPSRDTLVDRLLGCFAADREVVVDQFSARAVMAHETAGIEVTEERLQKCVTVFRGVLLKAIEYALIEPVGVIPRLQEKGLEGGNEHGLLDPC